MRRMFLTGLLGRLWEGKKQDRIATPPLQSKEPVVPQVRLGPKPTARGHARGAFGTWLRRLPLDPNSALRPAAMRALAQERRKELGLV